MYEASPHWPAHKEECGNIQSMRLGCPPEKLPVFLEAMLQEARLASAGLCGAPPAPAQLMLWCDDRAGTSEFGGRTVAGSEELAYRCLFDIGCFILSHLKMKRRFAGKCIHIINVMRRYPASTRVQTVDCLIIDKLALNETLCSELGASGVAIVLMRLLQGVANDDCFQSAEGSSTSLLFHAMGAMSSLALECPTNVQALHELGVACALLDAIKPHFYVR
jgi:hypothetical protein